METTYIRSVSTHFGGELNPYQFQREIVDEEDITTTINRIDVDGDVVKIVFSSSLSQGEEDTLDTLITNYQYVVKDREFPLIQHTFTPYEEIKSSKFPEVLLYYFYQGSLKTYDPNNYGFIVHNGMYRGNEGCYEMNIVLRDIEHNKDIFNISVTGDAGKNDYYAVPKVYHIPPLTNLPNKEAMFQLSCELVKGSIGRIYVVKII